MHERLRFKLKRIAELGHQLLGEERKLMELWIQKGINEIRINKGGGKGGEKGGTFFLASSPTRSVNDADAPGISSSNHPKTWLILFRTAFPSTAGIQWKWKPRTSF